MSAPDGAVDAIKAVVLWHGSESDTPSDGATTEFSRYDPLMAVALATVRPSTEPAAAGAAWPSGPWALAATATDSATATANTTPAMPIVGASGTGWTKTWKGRRRKGWGECEGGGREWELVGSAEEGSITGFAAQRRRAVAECVSR